MAEDGDVLVAADQRLSGMRPSPREQVPLAQAASGQGLPHRRVTSSGQDARTTATVQVDGPNTAGALSESETDSLIEQVADWVGSRSWPGP